MPGKRKRRAAAAGTAAPQRETRLAAAAAAEAAEVFVFKETESSFSYTDEVVRTKVRRVGSKPYSKRIEIARKTAAKAATPEELGPPQSVAKRDKSPQRACGSNIATKKRKSVSKERAHTIAANPAARTPAHWSPSSSSSSSSSSEEEEVENVGYSLIKKTTTRRLANLKTTGLGDEEVGATIRDGRARRIKKEPAKQDEKHLASKGKIEKRLTEERSSKRRVASSQPGQDNRRAASLTPEAVPSRHEKISRNHDSIPRSRDGSGLYAIPEAVPSEQACLARDASLNKNSLPDHAQIVLGVQKCMEKFETRLAKHFGTGKISGSVKRKNAKIAMSEALQSVWGKTVLKPPLIKLAVYCTALTVIDWAGVSVVVPISGEALETIVSLGGRDLIPLVTDAVMIALDDKYALSPEIRDALKLKVDAAMAIQEVEHATRSSSTTSRQTNSTRLKEAPTSETSRTEAEASTDEPSPLVVQSGAVQTSTSNNQAVPVEKLVTGTTRREDVDRSTEPSLLVTQSEGKANSELEADNLAISQETNTNEPSSSETAAATGPNPRDSQKAAATTGLAGTDVEAYCGPFTSTKETTNTTVLTNQAETEETTTLEPLEAEVAAHTVPSTPDQEAQSPTLGSSQAATKITESPRKEAEASFREQGNTALGIKPIAPEEGPLLELAGMEVGACNGVFAPRHKEIEVLSTINQAATEEVSTIEASGTEYAVSIGSHVAETRNATATTVKESTTNPLRIWLEASTSSNGKEQNSVLWSSHAATEEAVTTEPPGTEVVPAVPVPLDKAEQSPSLCADQGQVATEVASTIGQQSGNEVEVSTTNAENSALGSNPAATEGAASITTGNKVVKASNGLFALDGEAQNLGVGINLLAAAKEGASTLASSGTEVKTFTEEAETLSVGTNSAAERASTIKPTKNKVKTSNRGFTPYGKAQEPGYGINPAASEASSAVKPSATEMEPSTKEAAENSTVGTNAAAEEATAMDPAGTECKASSAPSTFCEEEGMTTLLISQATAEEATTIKPAGAEMEAPTGPFATERGYQSPELGTNLAVSEGASATTSAKTEVQASTGPLHPKGVAENITLDGEAQNQSMGTRSAKTDEASPTEIAGIDMGFSTGNVSPILDIERSMSHQAATTEEVYNTVTRGLDVNSSTGTLSPIEKQQDSAFINNPTETIEEASSGEALGTEVEPSIATFSALGEADTLNAQRGLKIARWTADAVQSEEDISSKLCPPDGQAKNVNEGRESRIVDFFVSLFVSVSSRATALILLLRNMIWNVFCKERAKLSLECDVHKEVAKMIRASGQVAIADAVKGAIGAAWTQRRSSLLSREEFATCVINGAVAAATDIAGAEANVSAAQAALDTIKSLAESETVEGSALDITSTIIFAIASVFNDEQLVGREHDKDTVRAAMAKMKLME